jgi:TolB-like protein/tetratricopeptide (TPR) repeat protein
VAHGVQSQIAPEWPPALSINSPDGHLNPLVGLIFFWCFSDNVISERTNVVYEFGPFRLEVSEHRLVREGRSIPLTGKAFDTLRVLVERHGTLVPKRDLMNAIWPETTVEENNLDRNISTVRKALGEKATGQQYIETVPRVGYRFVARISAAPAEDVSDSSLPTHDISAIAVLPFADMSPARDQDYLCEGLAEELINALTYVDGLRVAARTASFQFRGTSTDIRSVGQKLGVGTLLEGSVRKAGNRLRVTVQLIEVATGFHRWSRRFDRTLKDVFAIQDEIAESVATSLRGGVLSRHEKQGLLRPHTGAAAYEYYLRGRQYLPRLTQPDLQKSGEMFEHAIELDAGYSPALAGLAMVNATLYEWFGGREDDLIRAERASQKALQLAPGLAEAHVAGGFTLSLYKRYDEAVREFEDAIRINPNFFDAYYYFARFSFARGDIKRSAELFRMAAKVRHEDFQSPLLLSQSLRMLGRTEEANEALREGIHRAEHALVLNPLDGRALSLGSCALFPHQKARAMEWSQRALELYPDDMGTLFNAACLRAKAGLKEEAMEILERVFARGWGKHDWIERDRGFDILRDDPRFKNLLARLK